MAAYFLDEYGSGAACDADGCDAYCVVCHAAFAMLPDAPDAFSHLDKYSTPCNVSCPSKSSPPPKRHATRSRCKAWEADGAPLSPLTLKF